MNTKQKIIVLICLLILPATFLFGQAGQITGVVTDAIGKQPVEGVSVTIKGTKTGVKTGSDGTYKLQSVTAASILVFSHVGYITREELVGSKKVLNVALEGESEKLEDVVVVGYGTQKKVNVTGAIATVSSAELMRAPVSGISNALVGVTSGMQALQSSGEFGNDKADLRIRGVATLNTAAPLIMVDGMERAGYNDIDVNEIESISVLKDASSTAVFGLRGANGVILITTKQGIAGRPKVSVTGNLAALTPTIIPKTLNSYDYAILHNEAQKNYGDVNLAFTDNDIALYKSGTDPVFHPDKDWIKEMIKPVSFQQNYNVNVRGGSEKVRYFTSFGYFNQFGGYQKPDQSFGFPYEQKYNRYNIRMNFDFNLTNDFSMSLKFGNQITDNLYPNGGAYAAFDRALGPGASPMSSPGFIDGKIITQMIGGPSQVYPYNPWAQAGTTTGASMGMQNKVYNNTLNTNLSLKYKLDKLLKGLSFRAMGSYDNYYVKNTSRFKYFPSYTVMSDPANTGNVIIYPNADEGPYYNLSESIGGGKWRRSYLDGGLEYVNTFNSIHRVTALFLGTVEKKYVGNSDPLLPYAYLGMVGRATYDYKSKYLTEFNIGYTGSENFAPGKRFGLFPSMSLGWVLTEEKFLQDNKTISFLKIRGSYGEVGNDKSGGARYLYIPEPWSLSNGNWEQLTFGTPGVDMSVYNIYKEGNSYNKDVTWERAKKWNFGLEVKLFDNKLSFTGDYFEENRNNILWKYSTVPEWVSITLPPSNIGRVQNHGYEIQLEYRDRVGEFDYYAKALYSFARNKILYKDESPKEYDWMMETGKPIGQFFGLTFEGFYNTASEINDPKTPTSSYQSVLQPGDMKYKDLNEDGIIDYKDVSAVGYANWPEVTYSFSFGGSWKSLDFSVLFQGAQNVSSYFSARAGAYPFANSWGPAYEWNLERWSQERYENGEAIDFPRLMLSPSGHNYQSSSFWVQNSSYLRLKNVEIGYRFAPSSLKRLGISSMRVYLNGNNLLTWTPMKYPMDPEARELWGRTYPSMRVVNFGVNLQF